MNEKSEKEIKSLKLVGKFEEVIIPQLYELFDRKVKAVLGSGAVPDEIYEDNMLLARAIFDSICQDRPFQAMSPQYRKDFKNIHICS